MCRCVRGGGEGALGKQEAGGAVGGAITVQKLPIKQMSIRRHKMRRKVDHPGLRIPWQCQFKAHASFDSSFLLALHFRAFQCTYVVACRQHVRQHVRQAPIGGSPGHVGGAPVAGPATPAPCGAPAQSLFFLRQHASSFATSLAT